MNNRRLGQAFEGLLRGLGGSLHRCCFAFHSVYVCWCTHICLVVVYIAPHMLTYVSGCKALGIAWGQAVLKGGVVLHPTVPGLVPVVALQVVAMSRV